MNIEDLKKWYGSDFWEDEAEYLGISEKPKPVEPASYVTKEELLAVRADNLHLRNKLNEHIDKSWHKGKSAF